MLEWRIYYGDGSTFSNEDGEPCDAPRTDVQAIVQKDGQTGWEIVSEADFYYFEPSTWGWYMADQFTMFDYLIREKHPVLLFARMMSKPDYQALVTRVLAELPGPKTSWKRGVPNWLRGR